MQVGTTKDQGLYNKPSAAVHPGALAAGTLPQYSNVTNRVHKSCQNNVCISISVSLDWLPFLFQFIGSLISNLYTELLFKSER